MMIYHSSVGQEDNERIISTCLVQYYVTRMTLELDLGDSIVEVSSSSSSSPLLLVEAVLTVLLELTMALEADGGDFAVVETIFCVPGSVA